jgi:arginine-tRNA-protein transferase
VRVPLAVFPEHPCSYLPDRTARSRGFLVSRIAPEVYHRFMDAGFRRSGTLVYQPICRGCRACLQIRVLVGRFTPSKSQRRCLRRNQDLLITIAEPTATDEKYALYQRYQAQWHGKPEGDDRESFESFLYESPVETMEFSYRDRAGDLLAVGICDVSERSLSSVYFYHDPAHARRGLGHFGALYEIAWARTAVLPHYYLGHWVKNCAAMEYKSSYRPCEVLQPDGQWRDPHGAQVP